MMNTWNPAEIMERLNHLESIVKGIPTPVDVVANPEEEASTDLEKLTVGDTTYAIPEGTIVEANPEGEASTDLTKLTVGETIYAISAGGDYSTTEHLTGKTYNGAPEYEKTLYNVQLTRGTGQSFAHGISNLRAIHSIEYGTVDDYHNGYLANVIRYTDSFIVYDLEAGASSSSKMNITIKYTKTS